MSTYIDTACIYTISFLLIIFRCRLCLEVYLKLSSELIIVIIFIITKDIYQSRKTIDYHRSTYRWESCMSVQACYFAWYKYTNIATIIETNLILHHLVNQFEHFLRLTHEQKRSIIYVSISRTNFIHDCWCEYINLTRSIIHTYHAYHDRNRQHNFHPTSLETIPIIVHHTNEQCYNKSE
jgi:hypothetical protein